MKRNLRALGLALAAVLAIGAVVAQAASAQNHEFTSDSQNGRTVLTGADEPETNHRWFFGESVLECDHSFLQGTAAGTPVEELTLKPTYFSTDEEGNPTDCSAAGNPFVYRVNHCAYVLHDETDEEGHAQMDIECAEDNRIEMELTGLGTIITIEAQTGLHGLHYSNIADHAETGREAVTVETTIDDLDTSCEGFFCFLFETGPDTGIIEGRSIVTGYEDGGEALEGTAATTPTYEEGEIVNFTVE